MFRGHYQTVRTDPLFRASRVPGGLSFSRLPSQLQYSFLLLINQLEAENKSGKEGVPFLAQASSFHNAD